MGRVGKTDKNAYFLPICKVTRAKESVAKALYAKAVQDPRAKLSTIQSKIKVRASSQATIRAQCIFEVQIVLNLQKK